MVKDDQEFHWVQLALERHRNSVPNVAEVRPDRRLDAATEDLSYAVAAMPSYYCYSGYLDSVFYNKYEEANIQELLSFVGFE